MSESLHADLSIALATRLNLQISLSSLPVVEEWMDPKLDRWLESVPMPPEMPRGGRVTFTVAVASDLSRLRWGAHGHPGGFIPKMADYLSKCAVSPTEVALINALGERFEPDDVGSWIGVAGGAITTGWQFLDKLPLAELAGLAGSDATPIGAWCQARGIDSCIQCVRCIGDEPYLDMVVALPGIAAAGEAFSQLGSTSLSRDVIDAFTGGAADSVWLSARGQAGTVSRVALVAGGIERDAVERLCGRLGLALDPALDRLQGALGAEQIHWVEYGFAAGAHSIDLHYQPGTGEPRARPN